MAHKERSPYTVFQMTFNYNTVFAPTAAAKRFFKGHGANLVTYALIAAVILLAGAMAVLDFLAEHRDRLPEYQLQIQATKLKTQLWIVRSKRSAIEFVVYHGLVTKVERLVAAPGNVLGCAVEAMVQGEPLAVGFIA